MKQKRQLLSIDVFFLIADEMFGLISRQPVEMVFTCSPCSKQRTEYNSLREELQMKLMAGLEEVLTNLLSNDSMQHLLMCKAVRTTHSTWTDNDDDRFLFGSIFHFD